MFAYLKTRKTLLTVAAALLVALISAKMLVQGSAIVAIPWGVLAFLLAFTTRTRREALVLGCLFGFVVSYAYLWFDNTDTLTIAKVVTLALIIILPALFGLLCGLLASWLGWVVQKRVFRHK